MPSNICCFTLTPYLIKMCSCVLLNFLKVSHSLKVCFTSLEVICLFLSAKELYLTHILAILSSCDMYVPYAGLVGYYYQGMEIKIISLVVDSCYKFIF